MKNATAGLIALAGALALAGCNSGSNSVESDDGDAGTNTQPPSTVSFTQFVKDQIAQTSDTSQSVDINAISFTFPDDENPGAFDDILGGP